MAAGQTNRASKCIASVILVLIAIIAYIAYYRKNKKGGLEPRKKQASPSAVGSTNGSQSGEIDGAHSSDVAERVNNVSSLLDQISEGAGAVDVLASELGRESPADFSEDNNEDDSARAQALLAGARICMAGTTRSIRGLRGVQGEESALTAHSMYRGLRMADEHLRRAGQDIRAAGERIVNLAGAESPELRRAGALVAESGENYEDLARAIHCLGAALDME